MTVPCDRRIVEVKRTLDGKVIEYPAELLVSEDERAVLLYRLDEHEVIGGGRITLPAGTLSFGYFWVDRPYNVYHFTHGGDTLVYYINIGRIHSLTDSELAWDDYAVDVLAFPDGTVEVLDEDEVPETVDESVRDFIAATTSQVLRDLDAIVGAVEQETRRLGATIGR
jgi:predicted RNA-binding protein associated with RNAse of E/G family